MLTIYGVYRSRASRPLWLLGEIGMEFAHVPVIQAYRLQDPLAADAPYNTKTPEWLAMNPAGGVPFMKDGDITLGESLAINLYIARTYGEEYGPIGPVEDAQMLQWSFYAATAIEPHSVAIMYANRDHGPGSETARDLIGKATETLRRPLAVLDAHLSREGNPAGGRFTVADVNLAECLRYAQSEEAFLAEYPAVDGWLRACQSRPAFQEMWAKRLAEPE